MAGTSVGALAHLWRFPVKSMQGERLSETTVSERGIVGDRGYGLIETATGKVVSAKGVKAYPQLLACRAEFVEAPRTEAALPPVRIIFPDGSTISSDSAQVDAVLTKFFGRDVTLARTAPANFTIDEHQLDLVKGEPAAAVEAQLGSALFAQLGATSPVPVGAFFDAFPLSLLTTSTLQRLSATSPQSRFDERRFRMNAIVRSNAPGFIENDWPGRTLEIGEQVRVHVALRDPRCVMTTLAQGDLPRDVEVLRTLNAHNRVPVGSSGDMPCAGVYAVITSAGTLRAGDQVRLA